MLCKALGSSLLALIELPPSSYRDEGLSVMARIGGERGLFFTLLVELKTNSGVFSQIVSG